MSIPPRRITATAQRRSLKWMRTALPLLTRRRRSSSIRDLPRVRSLCTGVSRYHFYSSPFTCAAFYRKGSALVALGKYKEAQAEFKKVCKVKPQDKDARKKLKLATKLRKEAAFAEAIESEETKPPSETVDIESMRECAPMSLFVLPWPWL